MPGELPTSFLDPWEEVAIFDQWHTTRQRHAEDVGELWTPDPVTGKTGYQRLNNIARVAPGLGPIALPMAQEGVDPDDDPIVAFAAKQAALMQRGRGQLGMAGQMVYRPGAGSNSQAMQNRLRNRLDAAMSLGVVDSKGRIKEPGGDSNSPEGWAFGELRNAFMAAGKDMEYIDRKGNRRKLTWSEDPVPANMTNARMMHRQVEASESEYTAMVRRGARPMLAQVGDDPELRDLYQRARDQGMINAQGFLINPQDVEHLGADAEIPGLLGTAEEQGTMPFDMRRRLFEQIRNRAQALGVAMPYLSATGMKGGGRGSAWYRALGPQVEGPERNEARGALGALEAAGAAEIRPNIAGMGLGSGALQGGYDQFVNTVRHVNMGMSAPLQELQGGIRNAISQVRGDNPNWGQSQSDLGIVIERISQGEEYDIGSGFGVDPASEVARQRQIREAQRGLIDGHSITLGRAVASATPWEEGLGHTVLSGLIDFGVATFGDPANLIVGPAAGAGRARNLFAASDDLAADGLRAAGGMRSVVNIVDSPTADAWLNGHGTRVVTAIAETQSPTDIIRRSNYQMPPEVAVALADATDDAEVRDILKPLLGTRFRSTKDIWNGRTAQLVNQPSDSRWARQHALVPDRVIDLNNRGQVLETMDNWGRTVRMDDTVLRTNLDYIARAKTRDELLTGIRSMMRETDGVLDRMGVSNPDVRNNLIEQFESQAEAARLWYDEEIASPVPVWDNVILDDEMQRVGTAMPGAKSPHLAANMLNDTLALPDIRAIRRLTSNPATRMFTTRHSIWNTELMSGELRYPWLALQAIQEDIWKPITLMRPAWTMRVIGEEQVRIAASNAWSMANHPITYIAMRLGMKDSATDVMGNPLSASEAFSAAMSKHRGGVLDDYPWRNNGTRKTRVFDKDNGDNGYFDGWADELVRLSQDPIANFLANHHVDDTIEFLFRGDGQRFRDRLSFVTGVDFEQEALARAYLESLNNRITYMTGNDTDLLNAVRTGNYQGRSMLRNSGAQIDPRFMQNLRSKVDVGPQRMVGNVAERSQMNRWGQLQDYWNNQVVDNLFGALMTNRTNNLSRSPYFTQRYWQRMAELAPYVSDRDELRAAFEDLPRLMRDYDNVEGVKGILARRFQQRFDYQMSRTADPDQMISMAEADTLAKDFALQSTRDRLFDVSKRANWEDSMRLIAPFISAWKEVFSSWGKLALENPIIVRRGLQGIDAAKNSGFFYEDETTGELMFTYPGSEFVTRTLTGVPIPLAGRAQGLNFMSQVIPGIGPAVQVPVTFFMAGRPELLEAYQTLVPFGAPAEEGAGEAFNFWNYAPPFFKRFAQGLSEGKFLTSQQDQRTYNNTVMQIARYLSSTGEYNLDSGADWQRMMQDSKDKAQIFYLIRAGASATTPSAPAPQWLMETNQGLTEIAVLTEEYRALQQEDFETADDTFLRRWGNEVVLAMTPFSRTISWGIDPSSEFHEWEMENEHLKDTYPSIYGLFGPTGKFDIGVFSAQFRDEDAMRTAMAPDEWAQFSQHMLGQRIFTQAQTEVGEEYINTDEGRAYMREVTEYLHDTYPGWRNMRGIAGGVEPAVALAELSRIIEEPSIRDTELGETVRYYLDQRTAVLDYLRESQGYGITAEGAQYEREFLQSLADELITRTPTFERIFERVLSRELHHESDEEEEVTNA